ncbi:hypothetical protein Tco_0743140 [Tanacetum coccineum]
MPCPSANAMLLNKRLDELKKTLADSLGTHWLSMMWMLCLESIIKVDLLYEYGFLESITMIRADKKKYTFKKFDFS